MGVTQKQKLMKRFPYFLTIALVMFGVVTTDVILRIGDVGEEYVISWLHVLAILLYLGGFFILGFLSGRYDGK